MMKLLRLSELLHNRNLRKLCENLFSLSALQMVNHFLPLITYPYLARVLGVTRFGELAVASAVMVYFQTVADYGFSLTAVRNISRCREDHDAVERIFSSVMWCRVFLAAGCLLLLIPLSMLPGFRPMRLVLFLAFLMIPGHVLFPEWFFQGIEEMKHIAILNVLAKLFFTGTIFVFIRKESDYYRQPLLMAVGFFIAGVLALGIIRRKYHVRWLRPDAAAIRSNFLEGWPVFISLISPTLCNNTFFLGLFCGDFAAGIYAAANKLIVVANAALHTFSRSCFPFLARRFNRYPLYAAAVLSAGAAGSLCFLGFAPQIIRILYGERFAEAGGTLRILSIVPLFLAMYNAFGTNYMILQGHEKAIRNISLFFSITGFMLALPLISQFSYTGAAVSSAFVKCGLGGAAAVYVLLIFLRRRGKSESAAAAEGGRRS